MTIGRYAPLVWKQVVRRPVRSGLTVGGVAVAMFLFGAIQAMQRGVAETTAVSAADQTLVVYRQDRYCPMASQLPEHYAPKIEQIEGVTEVMPMRVSPTTCRTSLDVVTFRGVPADEFAGGYARRFDLRAGSLGDWTRRSDAALVGEDLARRRGLKVGDRFDAAGVTVYVAGIFQADDIQDRQATYVHLPFIQQNTGSRKLGIVTQFNVKVDDPDRMDAVGKQIDRIFRTDQAPTSTYPEKAFVARAAHSAIELISFTRYLGFACLAAVLALVGNAIVLSVQDRIRDHAILQTLGFEPAHIALLILAEGLLLGAAGGILGSAGVWLANRFWQLTLTAEGLTIPMMTDLWTVLIGLGLAVGLGAAASLAPAVRASRREIAACFRAA